jgi:UDP-2-acetamido-2-deoxy-ribo-hexuluronate aminotransferase
MNAPDPKSIPFVDLKTQYAALRDSIHARMQKVLDHGQFIMGPEVAELEEKLAAYAGTRHCVTCASGTEALLIALMALDIRPGDEVITTPFTFVSTAEVIVLLGATPVLVDIEPETCNIDTSRIEAAVTPRTRAILPVSLYGQPADMDEINAIAGRHRLPVIEDAAQSFGATYQGRKSCNLSTVGCTSFFPAKPLGCYGDGGALFTSDERLAAAMRAIRVHGQSERYHHARIGLGGRMDTLQCAVVLAKLERFDWELGQRQRIGARYDALLRPLAPRVGVLAVKHDRASSRAYYTVTCERRDELRARMHALGIPTLVHYPKPIHLQPAYEGRCRSAGSLAHAESAAARVLSLPMHPDLDESVQDRIVAALASALRGPAAPA